MRGRRFLLVLVLVILAAAIVVGWYRTVRRAADGAQARNVVLITLDTTRADHLGCYGYARPVSPRIDGFAATSALFTNAYCTASVTPVSHASILTGQYPYTHGLRVMHGLTENRLPPDAVTLAEALQGAGYETAAFVSAFPAGSRFGLDQGFDTFDEAFLDEPLEQIVDPHGTVNTGRNQRRAGETTDLVLDWLARVEGTFFLWVHYFDPHDPQLIPPPEFLQRFPVPAGSAADRWKQVYDLEIQYMDEQVGRVLDALAAAGGLEESVVVIVSDHGQGLGDHGWWTHGILYDEQIRAPLIIRAPGLPAGRRIDHLVRTVDLAPTVLELVGLEPARIGSPDGVSLAPMLAGEVADPGRVAYADSVNMLTYTSAAGVEDEKDDMLFAIVDGSWKYIHHLVREQESELYDLARDPRELNNLYAARPEIVERLLRDLADRRFQPEAGQGAGQMSAEDLERLRSLGYLR